MAPSGGDECSQVILRRGHALVPPHDVRPETKLDLLSGLVFCLCHGQRTTDNGQAQYRNSNPAISPWAQKSVVRNGTMGRAGGGGVPAANGGIWLTSSTRSIWSPGR